MVKVHIPKAKHDSYVGSIREVFDRGKRGATIKITLPRLSQQDNLYLMIDPAEISWIIGKLEKVKTRNESRRMA